MDPLIVHTFPDDSLEVADSAKFSGKLFRGRGPIVNDKVVFIPSKLTTLSGFDLTISQAETKPLDHVAKADLFHL
jgi:hypothetical protein